MIRRFSFVDDKSDKFWQVSVEGDTVTVNYGRTGTVGQTKAKSYASNDDAAKDADKQIAAKLAKGYVEESTDGVAMPTAAPVAAATAKPAPHKAAVLEDSAVPEARASVTQPTHQPTERQGLEVAPGELISAGDLGVKLSRTQAAGIAGGVPLESVEIPEATQSGDDVADHWEEWTNQHITLAAERDWWGYRKPTRPDFPAYEGVPDRQTAAWFEAFSWVSGLPCFYEDGRVSTSEDLQKACLDHSRQWLSLSDVPRAQVLGWAREAARNPDDRTWPRPLSDLPETMTPEMCVGMFLSLHGVDAVVDRLIRNDRPVPVSPNTILAYRAMIVPQLTSAQRDAIVATARDPQTKPADQYRLNALVLDPDEFARYAPSLGIEEIDHHYWVIGAAAMTDPQARLDLFLRAREHSVQRIRDNGLGRLTVLGPVELALVPETAEFFAEHLYGDDPDFYVSKVTSLLAALTGPGAVEIALDLWIAGKAPTVAKNWLLSHPELVARFRTSLQRRPHLERALGLITREILAATGSVQPVHPVARAAVSDYQTEISLPVLGTDADFPPWWSDAVAAEAATETPSVKVPKKVPNWLSAVPAIVVEGHRLGADASAAAMSSAIFSASNDDLGPRPLIAALRDRMTDQARDAVALALVRGWLAEGAPGGGKVYFHAAGFFGATGLVEELAPLVALWPGQSNHARAVSGLDVLASTGVTPALGAISRIANKSKFKGVKEAAGKSLERLAALRNLTRDQLEDQVIPDGGLDAGGTTLLDFGPRQFRAAVDAAGKISVRELDADGRPTGKVRPTLPSPNSKDDAELARRAKAEFSHLKKSVTEVATVQTVRLAQAMVTGREWRFDEHRDLYARHPVMSALIRPLIWLASTKSQSGNEKGALLVRVSEEAEYLNLAEEPVDLPADAVVTLAHPLFIDESVKQQWRQQLIDFELVPPFEQLDREVFGLPEGQPHQEKLIDLPQGELNPGVMLSTLEREGWIRSTPQDAGVMPAMLLPLPRYDFSVALEVTGLFTGMIGDSGPQQVESVMVQQGHADRWFHHGFRDQERICWPDVPPVVVSEVRRTLSILQQKMEKS